MKMLNDLPPNSRAAVVERLKARLAGALDLTPCVKQAH